MENQERKEVLLYELFENYIDEDRKIDVDIVVTLLSDTRNTMEMIQEYSEFNNIKIVNFPSLIDKRRGMARITAVSGKIDKVYDSVKSNDLLSIARTLTEASYFLVETFIEYGLQGKYTRLMKALHKSNMSKFYTNKDDLQKDFDTLYKDKEIEIKTKGDYSKIIDRRGGKVLPNPRAIEFSVKGIVDENPF